MGFFTINRRLLSPKAHYFLYFGGMASFWPFITVFAKQLGVTEVQVGMLFTVAPITGLICMPLFGALADRFKMKKRLFIIFNVINFFAVMGFGFLPTQEPVRKVNLQCGYWGTYITQNRMGVDSLTGIKSKCNVETEEQIIQTHHDLDSCYLTCSFSEEERFHLCDTFVPNPLPSFCRSDAGSSNDAKGYTIDWTVEVKTTHASMVSNVLHLPLGLLKEAGGQSSHYVCGNNGTIFSGCDIDCFTNHALDYRLQKIPEQTEIFFSAVFWAYVTLVLVSWIAFAVVTSVADAMCFQTLEDKSHLYGVQRQWGAIGWGLFSLLSGILVDYTSGGSLLKNYSACFYLVAVLLILNFIVCLRWDIKEEEKPRALGQRVWELISDPKIFMFILACIKVGICTGILWQFLFWFAEDISSCENMKYIKRLQGLISIVQCFGGELPFFYVSSWFIKKLGHVHCMTLVLGAFGLRFLIYSVLTNPWAILPVELLQGVTYGIFYSNMASYAYVVSPEGSAATVQGIVGAAFEGIGVGLGSFLGGILYKSISGRLAFRVFGISTICFCLFHHITMKIINKRFSPVPQNDADGYRNGHSKVEEMKDMNGQKFSSANYDSDS